MDRRIYKPHNYQVTAYNHILNNEKAGLFLDMGLGKTVVTLTAIKELLETVDVTSVLIIAPKRVANSVWDAEIEKWQHLHGLTIAKVLGSEKQRIAALKTKANIHIINRENVEWLCAYYGGLTLPFDMLIIDELSSFKNPRSNRFRALRQVRLSFSRVVGLTGTPAPNGLMDLWAQVFLLDGGERLYKTITKYRECFFRPGASNGHIVFKYIPLPGSDELIHSKIRDICISMRTEDYLELPECTHNYIEVELPKKVRDQYNEFEKNQILNFIDSGVELTAMHAASLTNKLLQFSNGAVYYETEGSNEKKYEVMHDEKIKELINIIEDANGQNILVGYMFKSDRGRLLEALKQYKPRMLETPKDEADWNEGKIQVLLTHPASAGHGLNLQFGGHIVVWFGETWNAEIYEQFNKRLHRQGQTSRTIINHIVCKDTVDQKVIRALECKGDVQNSLLEGLSARIAQYKKSGI